MPNTHSTAAFADHVAEYASADLPGDVLARTKDVLYDGLGAMLSATDPRYDIRRPLEAMARNASHAGGAQLVGLPWKTDIRTATLINGTLGYYGDIEPHHATAILHAMATVGPAALAAGERTRASGLDVLTALALGINVACRVSTALGPQTLYARGFHPTAVAGTFGAMAAAARLFGLRGAAMRSAFGLAGTSASGLLAWVSDHTEHARPFNMGLAASHGTMAAELAAYGFGGPPEIFEGKYPLGAAFTGRWDHDALFDGLGERFAVSEMYFKQYACCAFLHPGLDGFLRLRADEGFTAADIEQITLRFPVSGYRVIDNNALRSHSAQYILALAAYVGQVEFADVGIDRSAAHPGMADLMRRVRVIGDEELDADYPELYTSTVEVALRGGRVLSSTVRHPAGSPRNPLSPQALETKFAKLTANVVDTERAGQIRDAVRGLDRAADVTRLMALLGTGR